MHAKQLGQICGIVCIGVVYWCGTDEVNFTSDVLTVEQFKKHLVTEPYMQLLAIY